MMRRPYLFVRMFHLRKYSVDTSIKFCIGRSTLKVACTYFDHYHRVLRVIPDSRMHRNRPTESRKLLRGMLCVGLLKSIVNLIIFIQVFNGPVSKNV
jgi:hypothetical protein